MEQLLLEKGWLLFELMTAEQLLFVSFEDFVGEGSAVVHYRCCTAVVHDGPGLLPVPETKAALQP